MPRCRGGSLRMDSRTEKIAEKVIAAFAIALGLTFIYVPLFDFLESHSRQEDLSEHEQADIKSIRESQGQVAITGAVNRLMARPDVARVHVMIGEYDYPAFEIKRGKNVRPGEIGRHANISEHGYMVYIGYTRDSVGAPSERQEIKEAIRSIGSAMGGFFLLIMGFMNLAGASLKPEQKLDEKRPPHSPPPGPQPEDRTPAPREPDPVRYEGLRLVKGGD
jgi:hypothetical protein